MKKYITAVVTVITALISAQAISQQLIPFQARLSDGSGAVVADGVYSVNFNIYDAATAGTPLWIENHASVSVMGGVVNVILGSITPLDDPDKNGDLSDAVTFNATDGSRFIGVTIGTGQEMVPRHQLVPSFHSVTSDNAAKLGDKDPSYFAANGDLQAVTTKVNNMSGLIGAFTGACPSGWLIADGTSGTPDLRGRFLRGELAGNPASLEIGGSDNAIVVKHKHFVDPPLTNLSISAGGSHNHTGGASHYWQSTNKYGRIRIGNGSTPSLNHNQAAYYNYTSTEGSHAHSGSVNTPSFDSSIEGLEGAGANMPKYKEVIYCVMQ